MEQLLNMDLKHHFQLIKQLKQEFIMFYRDLDHQQVNNYNLIMYKLT